MEKVEIRQIKTMKVIKNKMDFIWPYISCTCARV